MSTKQFNLQLINPKIFLTVLVFSLFSGLYETLQQFFSLFLHDLEYKPFEVGLIITIWSTIVFILYSVFLFVILYSVCRRGFMENIAGIIISLVIGTVVGYWIGGLLGLVLSPSRFPVSPSLFIFSNLLIQFAVCSAAYINVKWRILTPAVNISRERPFGVTLISALYVVLGIFLTILTLIAFSLSYLVPFEALLTKAFLLIGSVLLLAIASFIYLAVAYGFYTGRRWGWLVVFASTLIDIFSSINQLAFGFFFDLWFILKILALLLGIFIFVYLLQPHVRIYFGVINPLSETSGNIQS